MTPAEVFGAGAADSGRSTKISEWDHFLKAADFDFSSVARVDLSAEIPVVTDHNGNRFSIDFEGDRQNYDKRKSSIKNELISRAMGAGRIGKRILDLSAGMAQDAVFLAQLGFEVAAVERNPLLFLNLQDALKRKNIPGLQFYFADAVSFLREAKLEADVIYFDPMFPDKSKKSALPRQEMVLFKNLVGADEDADQVLHNALLYPGIKRVVVKRPLKAPWLADLKPQGAVTGKLIRFDIYGVST